MDKACDLVFKDKKDKFKKELKNEYGYNFDNTSNLKKEEDYSKVYYFDKKNCINPIKKDR